MFNIRLAIIYLLFSFLVGCKSSKNQTVLMHHNQIETPKHTLIDISQLNNINVSLASLGYDGDALANSMYQANYNAAAQGGGAAGGLVGALIGSAIAQSAANSSAQKTKNQPVSEFINKINALNWGPIFLNTSLENISLFDKSEGIKSHNTLLITPHMSISSDYLSLQLNLKAEVFNADIKKPIYRNYWQINSQNLLKEQAILNEINFLNKEQIKNKLNVLINDIPYLIQREFEAWKFFSKKHSAIRFKRNHISYYERGTILEKSEARLIYRTLRGELKVYPYDNLL